MHLSENLIILLTVAICVAIVIICGELSALLAREKGYDEAKWRSAGRWTGILGIIAAAGLPDRFARRAAEDKPKPPESSSPKSSGLTDMSVSPSLLKKRT